MSSTWTTIIYCSLITLILVSCKPKLGQLTSINIDEAFKHPNVQGNISDVCKSIEYIPLETNDSTMLVRVRKLLSKNDRFYILDDYTQRIMVFNRSGQIEGIINSLGKGPKEYNGIRDYAVDDSGAIYILDSRKKCIHIFENYKYLKKVDIDWIYHQIDYSSNNLILYNPEVLNNPINDFRIIFLNPKREDPVLDGRKINVGGRIITNRIILPSKIYEIEAMLYVWDRADNMVYNLSKPNKNRSIEISQLMPASVIKSNRKDQISKYNDYYDFLETKELIFIQAISNGELVYIAINKEEGDVILKSSQFPAQQSGFIDDFFNIFSFWPRWCGQNELISCIDASDFHDAVNRDSILSVDARFQTIKPSDNPVLIVAQLIGKEKTLDN